MNPYAENTSLSHLKPAKPSVRERNKAEKKQRRHFRLFCGEIIFRQGDEVITRRRNAVLSSENPNVNAEVLHKAQQALQMAVMKEVNDASIVFLDVYLQNIVTLGFMTQEEFSTQAAREYEEAAQTQA